MTKEQIENAKSENNEVFFRAALSPSRENRELLFVLNNFGKLPSNFDTTMLLPLLRHCHEDVRLAAVRNLGKVKNDSVMELLCRVVFEETDTLVRREMVSAIGRMRNRSALPFLCRLLGDEDAKVTLQAIRALLCFKQDQSVREMLMPLIDHQNELIQKAISKEFAESCPSKRKEENQKISPDWLKNVLVHADTCDALRVVPDESVHLTFTSPPYYNARDYTIYRSYEDYLEFLVKVFTEVHRITKEGRFFVLNTSPVLIPRMGRNHSSTRYLIPFDIHPLITKIGFEFIDDIVWLKPDPSVKNRNGGFFQHRKPLGYKANSVCEYVLVYRKKTDKLLDWNMRQYDEETVAASKVMGDYNKTNAWRIAPSTNSVHSAVFPKELAANIIEMYSYKGDLIFDPFAGSGTVGQTSLLLERYYLLTEKENEYAHYAHQHLSKSSLYTEHQPRLLTLPEFNDIALKGMKR